MNSIIIIILITAPIYLNIIYDSNMTTIVAIITIPFHNYVKFIIKMVFQVYMEQSDSIGK